jgi:hypothetical protein
MAKNFRSPVVGKDPFMPDDMILVAFNIIDDAVIKRLHGYWTATLGVRR